jgi:hypothetical protein
LRVKKVSLWLCVFSIACFVAGAQAEVLRGPRVIQEIKHDVSLPLRDMAKMTPVQKHFNHEVENHIPRVSPTQVKPGIDEALQKTVLPTTGTTDLLNFDGQGADGVAPPDTEGSVGGTQYVQWVNLEYNVYDKTSGALILGPIQGNSFWSGFSNTACANNNDGDPIVLFDKLAGRWFVAQNVFVSPYTICLAVSATNDATGSYTRYAFAVSPSTDFPDYPKWGVWPDAYYNTYNAFPSGSAEHAEACAADRNNMLAGNTATIQCFKLASTYVNLLPADLDGTTAPPTGSPNYFFGLGGSTTTVRFWQFHVDFTTPSNSTFIGPTSVTIPSYTKITQQRTCVSQPTGGETLDCLGGRPQYRLAYRNFGTYESLLVAHTVKPTGTGVTAKAWTRWYEFRTPATPTLFQSGTVQNSDNKTSYWMGSIAQDKQGNMALGFSAASTSLDPSVYYVGRLATDPTGTMESPNTVVTGTGVQKSTSHRWGDYASMSVDPADDCTFYFTEEYIKTTGSFAWSTRINSFKWPGCS